ncbi:hypothetical protein BGZ63DRAFT_456220 [Mariannaea sp. PMI_226]|nr:hypothetical protein BGZ63DRAFT_456220 [Mariannaea sp. PMI_226]
MFLFKYESVSQRLHTFFLSSLPFLPISFSILFVTRFIMVQLKSLILALASSAFFLSASAGPCNVCSPANILQDGGFEGDSTPWQLDNGVTILANTADANYAQSGTHFVSFDVAEREYSQRYSISQQLSGLKPNQPYTLQYSYATTDNSGIHDGGLDIVHYLDGVLVSYNNFPHQTLDVYATERVTITPTSANPVLKISVGASGNYFYGATLVIDDISLGRACQVNGKR